MKRSLPHNILSEIFGLLSRRICGVRVYVPFRFLIFMLSRHSAGWKCPEFQAWTQPEFGVRFQILLDIVYAIQQDLNSNTKFRLNSGLKFRTFSTRGVTGLGIRKCSNRVSVKQSLYVGDKNWQYFAFVCLFSMFENQWPLFLTSCFASVLIVNKLTKFQLLFLSLIKIKVFLVFAVYWKGVNNNLSLC